MFRDRQKGVMKKSGHENVQNGRHIRVTHQKVDGFECRFIDDFTAVKERAILDFWVVVSLEDI